MQKSLADQAAEGLRAKTPGRSLADKMRGQLAAAKPRTVFDTAVALAKNAPNAPAPPLKHPLGHIFTFSGLSTYLGKTYRNPDQAWRNSREDARNMRNDLLIKECLESRQRATALLPFHVAPEDERDQTQVEAASILTKILEATPRFTEFRRSLLEGIWYGRQGTQFTFGEIGVNRRPFYSITSWLPINGDKLAFKYDGTVGIRVGMAFNVGDVIKNGDSECKVETVAEYGRAYFLTPEMRERVVVHKHMIEDADFDDPMSAGAIHGVGIRSAIYWTWFQKQSVYALLLEYLERSALGFEMWTFPWGNAEAEEKMRTAAQEKVGAGRNIILVPVMPGQEELFKYQRIEPGLEGARMINDIVHQFFNWQIKRYILGQILSSEPEGGGLGSSGLSDLQKDSLMSVVRYDSSNFDDTMTRELLPVLLRLNRHRMPRGIEGVRFRYQTNTESPDIKESLDAMQKAWQMGLKIKSEDLYKTAGLSKPQEGDEVLPTQQEQAQQGQAAGGLGGDLAGQDKGDDGAETQTLLDQIRDQLGQHSTLFDQIANPVKRYAAEAILPGMPREVAQRAAAIPLEAMEAQGVLWTGEKLRLSKSLAGDQLRGATAYGYALALAGDVPGWDSAWDFELAAGGLTGHAAIGAAEGLAEFARLAWTQPGEAAAFPACREAFVQAGLLERDAT